MELFAGIGCFGLGARSRDLTCVYANENDHHNVKTYEMNHCRDVPGISEVDSRSFEQVVEDVIKQVVEQVTHRGNPLLPVPPRATVLFAGFPCQPFSSHGKGQGLDCEKNGHYLYEILKLLICLQPPIVVLENVKPFAEKEEFGAMEVVHEELEELGYHVSHGCYKAVDFNLPQTRERLFIVAVRKDLATAPFKFKEPPSRPPGLALTDFLDPPVPLVNPGQDRVLQDRVWVPNTLNGKKTEFESKPSKRGSGPGLQRVGFMRIQGRKEYYSDDVVYNHTGLAGTLTTEMRNWYQVPSLNGEELIIRRLSLREGLRIQGLPEGFVLSESEKQARKQIGNSVAPPIAKWIVQCLQDQYPNIFNSDTCSTTEVWPDVQAPKKSPKEIQRIRQHLDGLESRRNDGQERRKAQRALKEETKSLRKTDEEEIWAALEQKLRI